MAINPWLPRGFVLADGVTNVEPLFADNGWQILASREGPRVLVVQPSLFDRWESSGLVTDGAFSSLRFGDRELHVLVSTRDSILAPVSECRSPNTKSEATTFASALKSTRKLDADSPLQDALYIEDLCRLLPSYSITSRVDDDVVLGYWLTGGAGISVKSFRRLSQMMSWLGQDNLRDVIDRAGLGSSLDGAAAMEAPCTSEQEDETEQADEKSELHRSSTGLPAGRFELPGRPELATFFNEHVVDIVRNRERYKALGIGSPSAIVLCGPPGCGKTFAVERLVEYLGWPSFAIDASSIASPYIHDTSKKVAQIFDKAMENAPSVLVMDEMDAFLADREGGVNQYRVEEVAEFLRRIPEAVKNDVLIVAMTNRIDMIDPAVIRRGRFDHVIEVGYPSADEVRSLLGKLLSDLPKDADANAEPLVAQLSGRPLSDVAFVVREAARLAARSGRDKLNQESLRAAMAAAPAREREGQAKRRIGFI